MDITLTDLGLALRAAEKETVDFFLTHCSSGIRREIEESLLGGPKSLKEVLRAQGQIIGVASELQKRGELILSKELSQKMV